MSEAHRRAFCDQELGNFRSHFDENQEDNDAEQSWIEQVCKENEQLQAEAARLSNELRNTQIKLDKATKDLRVESRGWQLELSERRQEERRRAERTQRAHQVQLKEASRQCLLLRQFCEQIQKEKEGLRQEIQDLKSIIQDIETREKIVEQKEEAFEKMQIDKMDSAEESKLWRQRAYDLHIQMRRKKSPGWDGFSRAQDAAQLQSTLYEERRQRSRARSAPPRRPSRDAPPSPSLQESPSEVSPASTNLYTLGIEATRDRIFQALGDSPRSPTRDDLSLTYSNSTYLPQEAPVYQKRVEEPVTDTHAQLENRPRLTSYQQCILSSQYNKPSDRPRLTSYQRAILNETVPSWTNLNPQPNGVGASASSGLDFTSPGPDPAPTTPPERKRSGVRFDNPVEQGSQGSHLSNQENMPQRSRSVEPRYSSTSEAESLPEPRKAFARFSHTRIKLNQDGKVNVQSTR